MKSLFCQFLPPFPPFAFPVPSLPTKSLGFFAFCSEGGVGARRLRSRARDRLLADLGLGSLGSTLSGDGVQPPAAEAEVRQRPDRLDL